MISCSFLSPLRGGGWGLALLLFLGTIPISLANFPERIIKNRTLLTPELVDDSPNFKYIRRFNTSNNLRRKAGAAYVGAGEFLMVRGVVTDVLGTPINRAGVKIWQANAFGFYNFKLNKRDYGYDPDFTSTGTSVTDEQGQFTFLTIFPRGYENRAPHIHFLIDHEDLPKPFETQMFFPNHPLNRSDPVYDSLTESQKALLTSETSLINPARPEDGKISNFNIRLDIIQKYRRM